MDERFGPRDLVDDATLRALSRRSDARGLARFAAHLALILATGSAVWLARGTWWIAPAIVVHGAALIFLFAPLHETIHRTAFRTRWLNDSVAWLAGLVLLLPPAWFRLFHFAHHRWTQDPARDPELNPPRPATLFALIRYVTGVPYWIAAVRGIIRRATGRIEDPFATERDRAALIRESRTFIGIYLATIFAAALLDGWAVLLWLWALPVVVGQPLLRCYLLAEHWGCSDDRDMLRNTRTTLTVSPIRFLAWNMPYHAEHHAFPGVPFHALPRLHERLAPRLAFVGEGYAATTLAIFQTVTGGRVSPCRTHKT